MPILVIFTNIISHLITQDQLINLRNVSTNGTSLIPLAIQTRIVNQCHLKCQYQRNLIDTDMTKELMSSPKCRSVEVINNPTRPGSNHKEINCINYK
jgi:hypothetical protein